jgi:hypothetical protein
MVVFAFIMNLFTMPDLLHRVAADPGRYANKPMFFPLQASSQPGSSSFPSEIGFEAFLQTAGVLGLAMAVLLAGSGLNTQTVYGMRQGAHPSMSFTLSLPVPRTRWLTDRALLGLAAQAVCNFLILSVPLIGSLTTGGSFSFADVLRVWPFFMAGSLVVFGVATFLATIFDELWQGMCSMLFVAGLIGLAVANGHLNIFQLMAGQGSWLGVGSCLLAFALAMAASLWQVETREF